MARSRLALGTKGAETANTEAKEEGDGEHDAEEAASSGASGECKKGGEGGECGHEDDDISVMEDDDDDDEDVVEQEDESKIDGGENEMWPHREEEDGYTALGWMELSQNTRLPAQKEEKEKEKRSLCVPVGKADEATLARWARSEREKLLLEERMKEEMKEAGSKAARSFLPEDASLKTRAGCLKLLSSEAWEAGREEERRREWFLVREKEGRLLGDAWRKGHMP